MKRLANDYFGAGLALSLRARRISAPTAPPPGEPFELYFYLAPGTGGCR